jgi:hypothetical protein
MLRSFSSQRLSRYQTFLANSDSSFDDMFLKKGGVTVGHLHLFVANLGQCQLPVSLVRDPTSGARGSQWVQQPDMVSTVRGTLLSSELS